MLLLLSMFQLEWQRVPTTPAPPARIIHAAAYDSARGRVVLFGGDRMRATPIGDTWEFDGAAWRMLDSTGPAARYGHVMAHAPGHFGTVLYGGWDKTGPLFDDTWRWDGARWTRLDIPGPPARRSPGAAYDPRRGVWVIFGGFFGLPARLAGAGDAGDHAFRGDTWEFDGRAWRQVATTGPAPRYGPTMFFDPVRRVVILFGGNDHAGNIFGDTWSWDGRAWRQLNVSGPPARGGAQPAWLAGLGVTAIVGGFAGRTTFTDTWGWDGQAWRQLAAVPAPSLAFPVLIGAGARWLLIGQVGGELEVQTWVHDSGAR